MNTRWGSSDTSNAVAARKNLPVCVLDDDADQVELSVETLQGTGFPTVGTISPDEALQKVRLGGCRAVIFQNAHDGRVHVLTEGATG